MDEIDETPPLEVDPYGVLELETDATPNDVKTAYRKLALRHHPDKALPSEKENAKIKFQEIAFAYAILSDERRRRRYDTTGNTSESLDIEDDDFNWVDFFRAQWAESVTTEKISTFQQTYQGSDEERGDVLKAYTRYKGDLNKVFRQVMLSNVLEDEDRFRGYIEEAIKSKQVEGYDAFVNETEKKRKGRYNNALKEAQEAEKRTKELASKANGKTKGKKNGTEGDLGDLAAMIQQRQQGRASNFLDNLESKYAAPQGKATKGKRKKAADGPSEEDFARTAAQLARAKRKRGEVVADETQDQEEEDEEDLGDEEDLDDFDEDEDEEEEAEETKKPSKRRKTTAPPPKAKRAKPRGKGRQ